MTQLDQITTKCKYSGYMEKYMTYPPSGLLPLPGNDTFADDGCDVWDMIFKAALIVNPAFNVYRIFDTYPVLWDVLGFPYVPQYALQRELTYCEITIVVHSIKLRHHSTSIDLT